MRSVGRLVAACAVAVTVGLGPATAFAASGSTPPPPASCFQVDSSGSYPTCTLVHGAWVRSDVSSADHNPLAIRAVLLGGVAVALLVVWAAVRASRSRRPQPATEAAIPTQPDAIDLDAQAWAQPQLIELPE